MTNTARLRRRRGGHPGRKQNRDALRAAFVYQEQRIPTHREHLISSPNPARLGALFHPLRRHLTEHTSRSAFLLEQQLWTHLAGKWTRYWYLNGREQERPKKPLYAPLDVTKREIRVLRVSRVGHTQADDDNHSESNKVFRAELLHVSLDENPAYIAISYTWGDPSTVGQFESDQEGGAAFGYNHAVYEILNSLVPSGSSLYLWIDAICINQRDNAEKASQVALMGEVYRRARQVVIHLGQADEDTSQAMDLLQWFEATALLTQLKATVLYLDEIKELQNMVLKKAGIPAWAWVSLVSMSLRRWFARYWVIQELALGISPVLVCGRHAVSWNHFACVYQRIGIATLRTLDPMNLKSRKSDITMNLLRKMTGIRLMQSIRKKVQSNGTCDHDLLPTVVSECGLTGFGATDPRDRIFAIMGLVSQSDIEDWELQPNYEIEVGELYTRFARHLITKPRNIAERLACIYRAGVCQSRRRQLPSWVPDWTSAGPAPETLQFHRARMLGADSITSAEFQVTFNPDTPEVAILHGCIIDSVAKLSLINSRGHDIVDYDLMDTGETQWLDSILALIVATRSAAAGNIITDDTPLGSPRWGYCLWKTMVASADIVDRFERAGLTDSVFDDAFDDAINKFLYSRGYDLEEKLDKLYCSAETKPQLGQGTTPVMDSYITSSHVQYVGVTSQRRFFISPKGYFGLAPPDTQEGDLVCAFSGMRTPIIIRPVESEGRDETYVLVGEAYHYGIAEGMLECKLDHMGPIRLV